MADEEAVRSLLARANLLRLRSQWDEAVAACTEALRRAPHSVTARSLLGDIYEAQGNTEAAVQWFGMAVEINPANQSDRAKLDRLVNAQRARLRTEEIATAAAAPSKPVAEKTLEWFDHVFPPGRSDSIGRLILAMSAGVALLLTIAAGVVYVCVTPRRAAWVAGTPPEAFLPPPVLMTPTVSAAALPAPDKPRASPVTAVAPSATRAPINTVAALRARIAAALDPRSATVTNVLPSAGNTLIFDIDLVFLPSETADHLRERAARIAALAGHAVATSDLPPVAATLFARVAEPAVGIAGGSFSGIGTRGSALVFTGQSTPGALRDVDVAAMTQSDLLTRFGGIQWYGRAVLPPPPTVESTLNASPAPVASPAPANGGAPATLAPVGT